MVSINLRPEYDENLAHHARLRWMTHWPPGHSWLFASVMMAGLSAGASTKMLGFLCVVVGGLGWVFLSRALGGSGICLAAVGAVYPWLSLIGRLYLDYKNDHLACAVAPWVYLSLMRVDALDDAERQRWGRLALAALMVGMTIIIKYSLMPVLIAAPLYLLWLDGPTLSRARVHRLAVFCLLMIVPGLLLAWVNHAWSETSYPLAAGPGLTLSLPVYAKNVISNTFGAASGWDLIVIQLDLLGVRLFRGLIFLVSAGIAVLWAIRFIRVGWDGAEARFGVFLCLLTGVLWTTLALMVVLSGEQYDYSSDNRFYMPVGFAWLVMGCLSLDRDRARTLLRSVAWYSLAIPVLFAAFFFGWVGLFTEPYPAMPSSRTAWTETRDVRHAAFLADLQRALGHKPDLLVATSGQYMTELGVPCFFSYRATRDDGRVYYSSADMEVWAMVYPADERVLLSNFRRAVSRERVNVPEGFPFVFYVFHFIGDARARQ